MIGEAPSRSIALLVGIVAFLAHSSSFDGQFLDWDDEWLVSNNVALREGGDLGSLIDPTGDRENYGGEYLPVRDLSYRIDHAIWGMTPRGFHLTNLLLHALAAALMFLLAKSLLGEGQVAALFAGLIYATHPLASEVVDCIAHRKGVLMAVFFIGAWLAWVKERRWWASALFVFAVFSKLPAIVLPGVLVLTDLALRRRFDRKSLVPLATISLAAIGAALVATMIPDALKESSFHGGSPLSNVFSVAVAYLEGVRVLLLPIGLHVGRINETFTRTSVDLMVLLGLALLVLPILVGVLAGDESAARLTAAPPTADGTLLTWLRDRLDATSFEAA